jgi:hypothetical protein
VSETTRVVEVRLRGHVKLNVDTSAVIRVPGDASDEEIYALGEAILDRQPEDAEWLDADNNPERAEYVCDPEVEEIEDAEADEGEEDATFIRGPDGKLRAVGGGRFEEKQ